MGLGVGLDVSRIDLANGSCVSDSRTFVGGADLYLLGTRGVDLLHRAQDGMDAVGNGRCRLAAGYVWRRNGNLALDVLALFGKYAKLTSLARANYSLRAGFFVDWRDLLPVGR